MQKIRNMAQNKYASLFFSIPISILYVVFFRLIVNYVMNEEKIDNMCDSLEGDPYFACNAKQNALKKTLTKNISAL